MCEEEAKKTRRNIISTEIPNEQACVGYAVGTHGDQRHKRIVSYRSDRREKEIGRGMCPDHRPHGSSPAQPLDRLSRRRNRIEKDVSENQLTRIPRASTPDYGWTSHQTIHSQVSSTPNRGRPWGSLFDVTPASPKEGRHCSRLNLNYYHASWQ
jgi:hypothetical protein